MQSTTLSQPWLTLIGIGEDGFESLSPIVQKSLHQAHLIYGGQRHLELLPASITADRKPWQTPFQASIDELLTHRPIPPSPHPPITPPPQNICILASGDPLCHGIGSTLLKSLSPEELQIIPSLSAFTLARSRLTWSKTEVETLSLCGRALSHLQPLLYPNAKILILSSDQTTPHQVCQFLTLWGYGSAQVTILQNLNGSTETILQTRAYVGIAQTELSPLNTIAIQCPAHLPQSATHAQFSLRDNAYHHDGQLTKQEIRSQTLAALAPYPGQLLWDVGAGCGSISIEWMRHHPRNRAIAIESHPDRLTHIDHNAQTLGVPNLQIISGRAPEALDNLEQPDTIFIGGGLTRSQVFETCWAALKPGGKLVANGVTLETEVKLFQLQQQYGGNLTRIQIQRAEPIGNFLGWKTLSPVTQWQVTKPIKI